MIKNKLLFEIIWWCITAVVVAVVMLPIWKEFPRFPYQQTNILYVITFITFTRCAFLLKYTFLADAVYVKIGFMLVTLALIAWLTFSMQDFQIWREQGDMEKMFPGVSFEKRESILSYLKSEFIFFAIGSIVAAVFLAGRLFFSFRRKRSSEENNFSLNTKL